MDLEKSYELARGLIEDDGRREDGLIKIFNQISSQASTTLDETRKGIKKRKAEIIVNCGIGYRENESMKASVPGGREEARYTQGGVPRIAIKDPQNNNHMFYFSRPLGIFIRGEPKEEHGVYYCRIIDERI